MSYPPEPTNPYAQQQPQPGHGFPQQPQPGQGAYGHPQNAYQATEAAPGRPPYAGWLSRVGARIIDGLVIGVVPGILYGIGTTMAVTKAVQGGCTTDPATYRTTCPDGGSSPAGLALMALGGLLMLVLTLWVIHREGTTGQTPGKKAVGIRVLREADGQPLGFGRAFGRQLCHLADTVICYLGYLWPLWDGKKQTLADKLVSSVVVKAG